MSQEQEPILLDAQGNKIKFINSKLQVPIAPKGDIALRIFQHYTVVEADEHFIIGAMNFINSTNNNVAQITLDNPDFQNFCISFGAENIINAALDENLPKAYALATDFMTTPEYKNNNSENLYIGDEDIVKIAEHFSNAPEIQLSLDVCGVQAEIDSLLDGTSGKKITTYQASRIQEKFDDIADYLNSEQKASGYYNISLIHRALLMEKDNYNPSENNAEKECLKKVLEYSSDYKKISYCVNRLDESKNDLSIIKAAYRRSLSATDIPADLYKIHTALAQCYLKEYRPKIGFRTEFSLHDKENEKLQKAEFHYRQAFNYAPKPERLNILKNIAKLQLSQNNIADWTVTKTKLAMKFLSGEDRVNVLLDIAKKNQKYCREYLEKALSETTSSKKINKDKKSLLLKKIDYFLRPLYIKDNNMEGIEKLDMIISKSITQNNQCPLLQYQSKKKQRT